MVIGTELRETEGHLTEVNVKKLQNNRNKRTYCYYGRLRVEEIPSDEIDGANDYAISMTDKLFETDWAQTRSLFFIRDINMHYYDKVIQTLTNNIIRRN